jgi:hypothetical protein
VNLQPALAHCDQCPRSTILANQNHSIGIALNCRRALRQRYCANDLDLVLQGLTSTGVIDVGVGAGADAVSLTVAALGIGLPDAASCSLQANSN